MIKHCALSSKRRVRPMKRNFTNVTVAAKLDSYVNVLVER